MACLVLLLLGLAAVAPWHSPFSVDNRTYLDMIEGVHRHGLPYISNGPVDEFVELRPRFHFISGGALWGEYPPAYVYAAAPAMALGGVLLVFRMGVVLLAFAAIATFLLGREISRSAWTGAIASWLLVCASPTVASYYQTLAQPLMLTFLALALLAVVRALRGRRRGWAAAAGGFAGLAAATHLLGFPMSLAIFAMLLFVRADGEGFTLRVPDRAAAMHVGVAVIPYALAIAPQVLLNRIRWGGLNPVSYGPCIWHPCTDFGTDAIGARAMLVVAFPAIAWTAALVGSLVLVRVAGTTRAKRALLAVAAITLLAAALFVLPTTRARIDALGRLVLAYVVNPTFVHLGWGLSAPPTTVGVMTDSYVLKALFQCSPAFAVVVATPFLRAPRRAHVMLLCAAPAALFASLSPLANLPPGYALGFPFIFMRYCTPALPFLSVATAIILRDVGANANVALLVLVVIAVAVVGVKLLDPTSDASHAQRLVLVRGTLVVAAIAAATVVYAARSSRSLSASLSSTTIAAAIGFSVAITALDARRMARRETDLDAHQDALARVTPPRFGVMGFPQDIDAVLPVRASKDVQAADLAETTDWQSPRRLIDRWEADARPVFVITHDNDPFPPPWRDVRFEPADAAHGIYTVNVQR